MRDGINIISYYLKTRQFKKKNVKSLNKQEFKEALFHILDISASKYCSDEYQSFLDKNKKEVRPSEEFFYADDDEDLI